MSLNFLPTPVFLAVVIGFSIVLLFYANKTFSGDGKQLSVGYCLLGLSGLCAAISRGIEKYFEQIKWLSVALNTAVGVFLVGGFSLIVFSAYQRTQENPPMRKILIISISIIVAVILLVGLVVLTTKK